MAGYSKTNLKNDPEDQAPNYGLSPDMEYRVAREPLDTEQTAISYLRMAPEFRQPFGHKHKQQEEIYVLLEGTARVKLDKEIVELEPWDALRIAPEVMRCVEAGSDGAALLLYAAPRVDMQEDVEMAQGWWTD
jgi:mannose-6-phosphate isomerase-like protein (cupin superfamily)